MLHNHIINIIKKIIYEDGSEDEVEDARHIQPKQINNPYYHESYTNLVYQVIQQFSLMIINILRNIDGLSIKKLFKTDSIQRI